MCPSCHSVAEIKKVTARYGYGVTRACMIPPLWRTMRTRRTPQHASSAVCEKVYGMPGRVLEIGCKLGEEKNCMGPFTNDKQ